MSSFGINVQKYHLFTIYPIWSPLARFNGGMGYQKLINKSWFDPLVPLKEWLVNENTTWRPFCFIVDDALQQHHTILYNYQLQFFFKKLVISITIRKCGCFNWKNLTKKIPIIIMFNLTKVPFWTNQFGPSQYDWVFFQLFFLTYFLIGQQCFDNDYIYNIICFFITYMV
jgi:hypothetical protein